jgi:hypothetical protein
VGRVFAGTNLRKEWVTACVAAGLGTLTEVEGKPYDPIYSGLTPHNLRRSAVRNLVNAGHKTRSVFDGHHIVSTVDVIDAMQKVVTASLSHGGEVRKPCAVRAEDEEGMEGPEGKSVDGLVI